MNLNKYSTYELHNIALNSASLSASTRLAIERELSQRAEKSAHVRKDVMQEINVIMVTMPIEKRAPNGAFLFTIFE